MSTQQPLKVVHVVRQFHPGVGGMENFVEHLALQQLAGGMQARVVTLDRIFGEEKAARLPRQDNHLGINVIRVPFVGSRRYPVAPRVLFALRDADLVHVHGVDFFCDYLAATVSLHCKPLVLTTHGGFFHTSFARPLKWFYFAAITRASLSQYGAVIACSEEDERVFGQISASRLALIANPVDIDKFRGLAARRSTTMIYFGRLAPNKETSRLMRWFAVLAASEPQWRLIIAGKPMGTTISELAREWEELGNADQIEIHNTPTDDELKQLIGQSSVYCCASSYEGFGMAAIEAAAAGLYPVLSTIPPFHRSIERLGYGMNVDFADRAGWPASFDALKQSFQSFADTHDDADIRRAVEPFAWPAAIPAFDFVYDKVLGRSRRRIGRVEVDLLDRDAATRLVLDGAYQRRAILIAFCNAHTVNLAHHDRQFCAALQSATVLNDGVGMDIASRALYRSPFPDNLNGTDFVPHLLRSADKPLKLFLLGGEPGVAEAAGERIRRENGNIIIAGAMHGYFADRESESVVETIRASKADLILVAMGQPRQEIWAAAHFRIIDVPVLCVGALLDFLAGRVPRAPLLWRKLRLEWAFRFVTEPRRLWRRYLVGNFSFMARTLLQRLFGPRI